MVAVFLALALGIGMGVTVIDKATVDRLDSSLKNVRNEVNAANQRSDSLQRQAERSTDYESRVETYMVDRKLNDVPIVIVAIAGVDEGPLKDFKRTLTDSGAKLQGTLWFTEKSKLDDQRALPVIAEDLGATGSDPAVLRQALLSRVNGVLAGAAESSSLDALVDDGFLEWQAEKADNNISGIDFGISRVVIASGAHVKVANDQIAVPLVRLIAAQPTKRLVVVESGRESDGKNPAERAVFVGPLRNDGSLNGKLSTVDNLETSSGRVASVIALQQLATGQTGNYGYGDSGPIPKFGS